ncbi:exopolysaccharide Pel transporter PelG [Novosphingobium sp. KCTC 2891]|uniref:exopolysaccharide Pel transporter PelG n=1 Tax=Novosphingobium sp. KCTC 2891 TaxID=2989730 RepID=UPI002222CB2F|nr:exopolysaccharide Pel transporter PelG [Novosphingobium sp. KCTC 2891]MCW1381902.1 exopolysaccharide Pel transporter PelG [Novosphingobium sp. KCTC 2891]
MAGIGFQLERMARDGGVGGFVSASLNGAIVSSGPWVLTICAVLLLQGWIGGHLSVGAGAIQTIMVYAFSASVVIASPFALIGVRIASDRMFDADRDAIPGILILTLSAATVPALIAGQILFGILCSFPADMALLAVAILTLLTQISVAGPFLTAMKRPWPILFSYVAGIAAASAIILVLRVDDATAILATVAAGMAVTACLMLGAFRAEFPAPPRGHVAIREKAMPALHVGLAGLMNALALWIDKWLLWFAPDSIAPVGQLRVNPIYDQASFAGLLTLIPGLSLMLFLSETRLERAFMRLVECCTGTSKLSRIEEAQQEVVATILRNLRLLIVTQFVISTICWVLAPEIFRVLGFDARGIFAFRFTVIGVIFHVATIYAAVVLSYYDLFGRIVAVWATFFAASIAATLLTWHLGFAGYGWGYMTGALAAAIMGLALVGNASSRIIYLLFVGNNPSVVGEARYLA